VEKGCIEIIEELWFQVRIFCKNPSTGQFNSSGFHRFHFSLLPLRVDEREREFSYTGRLWDPCENYELGTYFGSETISVSGVCRGEE
jgi:hypothetical protein